MGRDAEYGKLERSDVNAAVRQGGMKKLDDHIAFGSVRY